jgi:hypothetical protein
MAFIRVYLCNLWQTPEHSKGTFVASALSEGKRYFNSFLIVVLFWGYSVFLQA